MDKELNNNEERLFELLESKDFGQLNEAEKKFVSEHSSEADYRIQRKIILDLGDDNGVDVKPLPLMLPNNNTGKVVPLPWFIGSVAAMFLLGIFAVSAFYNQEVITQIEYITQVDTLEIEKHVYDTIYQEKEVVKYYENKVYLSSEAPTQCDREEPRLLETESTFEFVNIEDLNLENKGKSINEDESRELIVDYSAIFPN
ncbi:MAG: hypothetical protein MK078_09870 [Crocinitomicaceae bacterium]|nr:hypothetical protein [Crocinitomicaceae bacterium]